MDQNIYQKLYAMLCGAASDAVDALDHPSNALLARCILVRALQEAEELYIQATEDSPLPENKNKIQ